MALPAGTIDDPSADQPTFWPAHLHIWCDNFKRELCLPGHIFNARVNGDLLTVEPRAPMTLQPQQMRAHDGWAVLLSTRLLGWSRADDRRATGQGSTETN